MREYTPLVEVFSIDEAWMDVTHSLSLFGSPENIAYQLKAKIKHRFGIICSIGIAHNKLMLKLASEMKKPDGLTRIKPEEVERILEHMPANELCGIGKKMERHLFMMGIRTFGELVRYDDGRLTRKIRRRSRASATA